MVSRRKFLQSAALFGAGFFLPKPLSGSLLPQDYHPRLDPTLIPKYAADFNSASGHAQRQCDYRCQR